MVSKSHVSLCIVQRQQADRSHGPLDRDRASLLALWALIAAVSPLSEIVCQAITGAVPNWLTWARIGVTAVVFAIGTRKLRVFCAFYAFHLFLGTIFTAVRGNLQQFLSEYGFVQGMLRLESLGMVAALLVLALVWCLRRRRERIYLKIGNLAARLQPTWITIGGMPPLRWRLTAPVIGLASSLVVWEFVRYAGQPVPNPQRMAAWAILFAAMNAFVEESIFRNALLSSLEPEFGAQQAIFVSATIFGLGHWNGLPSGTAGVLMTWVFGYLAAKAMVETKGMFWPWFMHALPDCVIFYYWGIGSLRHG
jgi:hypothetical protein